MTPVVRRLAARFSQSMISSPAIRGRLRFMVYDGALNTRVFLLLRRSCGVPSESIFIVDNLRVHHARIVVAWVEGNEEKIELIFLPAYAP